ncbi:MAG: thermonuclease family protein [Pseudomonadota bacterium]
MRDSSQSKFTQTAIALAMIVGASMIGTLSAHLANARSTRSGASDNVAQHFEFATAGALSSGGTRIFGKAAVIDGDTLDVAGIRVRLEGIDAPELSQVCPSAVGGKWRCGKAAKKQLKTIISNKAIHCKRLKNDKYGRAIALCRAGGTDINAKMVASGHAWAFVKYSKSYSALEAQARSAGVGVWQKTGAMAPWAYRARRWASAEQTAPRGCAIKGNISKRGRIYHMPWSRWYRKTRIETTRGEQWFCSEKEAKAAGWRPASEG